MATNIQTFRRLALSLANAYESAHMGSPDFRITTADGNGRIFATLASQDMGCGNLMLTLEQQRSFVTEMPRVFEPIKGGWGRMGMTHVHLDQAEEDVLLGALTTAHRNVAAKLESRKSKTAPRAAAVPGSTSAKAGGAATKRSKKAASRKSLE